MVWDSWYDVLRIAIVGISGYAALLLILRATGKRTLSKMNAFDLVVTVALGSTLASALLSKEVSFAEGLSALALLCFLQYIIAFAAVRSPRIQRVIKANPRLLFFRGTFLRDAMLEERVSEEEIYAAARSRGALDLSAVYAVVLETDGSISVLAGTEQPGTTTLRHVNIPPHLGSLRGS